MNTTKLQVELQTSIYTMSLYAKNIANELFRKRQIFKEYVSLKRQLNDLISEIQRNKTLMELNKLELNPKYDVISSIDNNVLRRVINERLYI